MGTVIVTPAMLEAATASIVLGKIEEAEDAGYVPTPDECLAAMYLMRPRIVGRKVEHQPASDGYRVRWRYFALDYQNDQEGGNE